MNVHIPGRRAGKVNFGFLFGLVVLLSFVYGAFKWVPVKVAIAELRDTVTNEATMAAAKKNNEIIYIIDRKIHELDALRPANLNKDKDIIIDRTNDRIEITIEVDVPVEIIGGKIWHIKDKIQVARPLFG